MSTPSSQRTDPAQLRREIEQIRRELRATVAQLGHTADVEAHAREQVQEVKANALRGTPDTARGGAQPVATSARRHPWPLAAVGAFAAGFLVGRAIRRE